MANVTMTTADERLLNTLSGSEFPYAEALTSIMLPISTIAVDRVASEKYGTEMRTTRNGKSTYTHKAIILHDHPQCPEQLQSLGSIGLLDWEVAPMLFNNSITEASLPVMTKARRLVDGSYDCAFMRVTVLHRIVGETYQRKGGKPFTTSESADGRYSLGDMRIIYEVSPNDSLILPDYIMLMKQQALVQAEAEGNQRRLEESQKRQELAKQLIPEVKISKEELQLRASINGMKNVIAEHNATIARAQQEIDGGAKGDAAKKAASTIDDIGSKVANLKAELAAKEEELEAIQ